jgi:hypothetical protein
MSDVSAVSDFIDAMFKSGIKPYVGCPAHGSGIFDLNRAELIRFMQNPDQYWADYFKVSLPDYLAWKVLNDEVMAKQGDVQCRHIKKDGKQCRNYLDYLPYPDDKSYGMCRVHKL